MFKNCLFQESPYEVLASKEWIDDRWAGDQENRVFHKNEGYRVINEGVAEGAIVGGNLCTLNLLQGTEYMPSLKNTILFLEDDSMSEPFTFDRDLQSLIHQPEFTEVKGIVFGRFQTESHMTNELLVKIVETKKELAGLPIISGADFGHTTPMITIPIGGTARISARQENVTIEFLAH
ncbi:hypothetical protein HGA88_04395 [Candidatus Roizmanbacteria bacterium]|nr:hypothetical protein [Candidatus Roizmanbacteria bacterium]